MSQGSRLARDAGLNQAVTSRKRSVFSYPKEIRLSIYAAYFTDNVQRVRPRIFNSGALKSLVVLPCEKGEYLNHVLVKQKRSFAMIGQNPAIALLLVSRAMYLEAISVLYDGKHFEIEKNDVLNLPRRVRSRMKSITLEDSYDLGAYFGGSCGLKYGGKQHYFLTRFFPRLESLVVNTGFQSVPDIIGLFTHLAKYGCFESRATRVLVDAEVVPYHEENIEYSQKTEDEKQESVNLERGKRDRKYAENERSSEVNFDSHKEADRIIAPLKELRFSQQCSKARLALLEQTLFGDSHVKLVETKTSGNGNECYTYELKWPDHLFVGELPCDPGFSRQVDDGE